MRERVRLERERFDNPSILFGNQSFIRKRERLYPPIVRERLTPFVFRERLDDSLLKAKRVRLKEQKLLTILEVENGKCRWPVSRAPNGRKEHLFCGNDVTIPSEGKPRVYCDWHHAEAHGRKLPELKMAV